MEFFRIKRDIPFMRHALVFNVISFVTFALAVFFLVTRGLHFSIEFTGGNVIEVEYAQPADVGMPDVDGFPHPLAACYRVSILSAVRGLIDSNRLRPIYLADTCATRFLNLLDFGDVDPTLQSLRNVNTPEEYEAALRDAAQAPAGPE